MKQILSYLKYTFQFPAQIEPVWSKKVERWYQLDAYAYGLAQAYEVWKEQLKLSPELLILASPESSNQTDLLFAQSGAMSPSKFVHTLPNVRGSSLCQVMNWNGPVLCIQSDPFTIQLAIQEGIELVDSMGTPIWILGVTRFPSTSQFEVHGFVIGTVGSNQFEIIKKENRSPQVDQYFLQWLHESNSVPSYFGLGDSYELRPVMRGTQIEKNFKN